MPSAETQIKELSGSLTKALTRIGDVTDRLKKIEEGFGDGTYSAGDLKQEIANISAENAKNADAITAVKDDINKRVDEFEKLYGAPDYAGGRQVSKRAGHLLVDSVKEKGHKRNLQSKTRIEFKSWNFDNRKTITDATGSGEDLLVPQYETDIIGPAERQMTIRALLPVGQTQSPSIIFMLESSVTDNAGPQVNQGDTKGESNFVFTRSSEDVETLAHWVKVSTQMLEYVAQLRSYINTRMRFLLMQEEENQLLLGDGTSGNLNGLVTQATAFDTTLLTDLQVSNATDLDRLRAAILQVQLAEYAATSIVLNPFNWAALELRKDGENRYIFAVPQNSTVPRLWGLPVVSTTAMTRGQFLTGAFQLGAQIWDRQGAAVAISTEDDDNFQKNLATIRAEERLALTVYRPESFVKGNFAIGSGS